MNVIRTTVTNVQIDPNGTPQAPFFSGLVRPGEAKFHLKPEFFGASVKGDQVTVMSLRFKTSSEIFALIDALRVAAESLRAEEEAALSRGQAAINTVAGLVSAISPEGGK